MVREVNSGKAVYKNDCQGKQKSDKQIRSHISQIVGLLSFSCICMYSVVNIDR